MDAFAIPPAWSFRPTLDHFAKLFTKAGVAGGGAQFVFYLMNSVIITAVSTCVSMGVACYAGYSLARIRPAGSTVIELAILGLSLIHISEPTRPY